MANLSQAPSRTTPNLLHILDAFINKDQLIVNTIIELNSNTINKYELITETGHLKLDRVGYSSLSYPFAYGCIPRTWDEDGDPLDICVFTEREIPHGDILVEAKVIGGMRMIDGGEADDKIIAVLAQDEVYNFDDIHQAPDRLVKRLKHYFLTYKQIPDEETPECEITHVYGAEEAKNVINLALQDYTDLYGNQ